LLDSVVVVPSEMSILIGSSETIISITAHYDNETTATIALASDDVSYDLVDSTDTPDIITVNDSGVVTGVSAGTAEITVSYTEGEITKTAAITVTVPSALNYIKVLPEFMNIYEGNSQTITSIKAYYEGSTTPVDIALSEAIYKVDSIDTQDIITVDSGVVTGELASDNWQTITVSYKEGSITETDTIYVMVEEAPKVLTSLTVIPPTMGISVGSTGNILRIIAGYSNATAEDVPLGSADVGYISSHPAIATVDTGVVTGVSVGTATITVGYAENGITKTGTVAVTVIL